MASSKQARRAAAARAASRRGRRWRLRNTSTCEASSRMTTAPATWASSSRHGSSFAEHHRRFGVPLPPVRVRLSPVRARSTADGRACNPLCRHPFDSAKWGRICRYLTREGYLDKKRMVEPLGSLQGGFASGAHGGISEQSQKQLQSFQHCRD